MSRDTNFYYSFLVLPPEKRRAIVAVWDFCRAVDDAVDQAGPFGHSTTTLTEWRDELARCFDAGEPRTPQGRALQPYIREFRLPRDAFEAIVDGVEMDTHTARYATFPELHQYCLRVASAVGLVCVEIFGYTNPRAKAYATELGVALQLTNILRDVPEDLSRGRLYIPLEDLAREGCTEDDLHAEVRDAASVPGVRSAAVKRVLAAQARRAREYYARADAALPREDARRLAAAVIMGAVYREILGKIEQHDYDVFTDVIRIPRPRRAAIAGATWLKTLVLGRA